MQLNSRECLFFSLHGEVYGTNLRNIREAIRMLPIKPVPHTASHFVGVINLRGEIMSVVDLRIKFGLTPKENGPQGLILVVETRQGTMGAIVDDVVSILKFSENQIQLVPAQETRIPMQFFEGIIQLEHRSAQLIHLAECMIAMDMRSRIHPEREAS